MFTTCDASTLSESLYASRASVVLSTLHFPSSCVWLAKKRLVARLSQPPSASHQEKGPSLRPSAHPSKEHKGVRQINPRTQALVSTRPAQETSDVRSTGLTPQERQTQLSKLPERTRRALSGPPDGQEADLQDVRGCIIDEGGRRRLCPSCGGRGFIQSTTELESCPVCQQWPDAQPLRRVSAYPGSSPGAEGWDSDSSSEGEGSTGGQESAREVLAYLKRQQKPSQRKTVKISPEQKSKYMESRIRLSEQMKGVPQSEQTKRRISESMRQVQKDPEHRRKVSESLKGQTYACSLCGEEGHNRRTCPQNKDRHKKLAAAREAKKEAWKKARSQVRRPKSSFKGLTWYDSKAMWRAQLWTGRTAKTLGYFEDEATAARAYDKALVEARGFEQARQMGLNFPEELSGEAGASEGEQGAQAARQGAQTPQIQRLPLTSQDAVEMAVTSIVAAYQSGVRRQRVEFMLPVKIDGEAGGVREEFRAARDMVEATLVRLKKLPGFGGRISVAWLDKTDCVGSWQSETLAAVVFCTADCLPQLRNIDGGDLSQRLTLVFNPQWQTSGQIVSEFGFGQRRRDAEEFLQSFQDVFFMQRRRVMGDSIRILKCFGSSWQVHYVWPNGKGHRLVSVEEEPPSYQKLLALLQSVPGSKASRSWVERVLSPDWLPGSDVPSDADPLQSGQASSDPSLPGAAVIRGPDNEAAVVETAASPASSDSAHDSLAPMSASPVKAPEQSNPVDSLHSLAAAAAADGSALDNLSASPPKERPGPKVRGGSGAGNGSEPRSGPSNASGPERFGSGEVTRDLLLDPVNNLPKWQRRLLSNSFGKASDDLDSGKAARQARIAELRTQLGKVDKKQQNGESNRSRVD